MNGCRCLRVGTVIATLLAAATPPLGARVVISAGTTTEDVLDQLDASSNPDVRLNAYAALLTGLPVAGDPSLYQRACSNETDQDVRFACAALVGLSQPRGLPAPAEEPASDPRVAAALVLGAVRSGSESASRALEVRRLLGWGGADQGMEAELVRRIAAAPSAVRPRAVLLAETLLVADAFRLGPRSARLALVRALGSSLGDELSGEATALIEKIACRVLRDDNAGAATPLGAGLSRREVLLLAQFACVPMSTPLRALAFSALTGPPAEQVLAVRALGRSEALPDGTTEHLGLLLLDRESSQASRRAAIEVLASHESRYLERLLPQLDPMLRDYAQQVLALVRLQSP